MSYRNSSNPIYLDKVKKEAVIDWVPRRSLSLVAVQATAQEYYSKLEKKFSTVYNEK